jgi:hypothetical protein
LVARGTLRLTNALRTYMKLALDTNAQLVQYAIKWHGTPAG